MEEYIGWFKVSVHDFELMHDRKALEDLSQNGQSLRLG